MALIDVGKNSTIINLIQSGEFLFAGHLVLGGSSVTEDIASSLELDDFEAEAMKIGKPIGDEHGGFKQAMKIASTKLANEVAKQLEILWGASESERPIEQIYLSGGASKTQGFVEQLGKTTGLPCVVMNPLSGVSISSDFSSEYLEEINSNFTLAIGAGLRRIADKPEVG